MLRANEAHVRQGGKPAFSKKEMLIVTSVFVTCSYQDLISLAPGYFGYGPRESATGQIGRFYLTTQCWLIFPLSPSYFTKFIGILINFRMNIH